MCQFCEKITIFMGGEIQRKYLFGAKTDLEELPVPGVGLLESGATRLPDLGIFYDFGRLKPRPWLLSWGRMSYPSAIKKDQD
jgi:hypothetical protein